MVKTITIFCLRQGFDPKDTRKVWGESHVTWVRKLPGLKKYVINWVTELLRGEEVYGIVELWFEDAETARKTMLHLPIDDFGKRLYHVTMTIVEENEVAVKSPS